jgi:hypothetical protein
VFGEFRYVEILIVGLLALNFQQALRYLGRWEKRLAGLFLLTATAYIVADLITNAALDGTIKRSGTYVLLALLLIALKWLGRGDPARILWMLAGYCFSYLFVFLAGIETPSRGYLEIPWRLGLGMAATIAVTLAIAWQPRLDRIGALALLALAVVHWMADARALAAITGVTGLLALWASFYSLRRPSSFRLNVVAGFAVLAVVGILGLQYVLTVATENQLFSEQMQRKMEMQLSNPYGLIGGGRGDAIVALYAISKRPIVGHGSTNVDPDVWYLYAKLAAETYAYDGGYQSILGNELNREWVLGTPSHSHLLGAWADAGVLASLSWFAVLGLTIYVLVRVMFWRHSWMPLIVLIAVSTLWDVLFSPGPTRMDMAFRLIVLAYAADMLRSFDVHVLQARATGQPGVRWLTR